MNNPSPTTIAWCLVSAALAASSAWIAWRRAMACSRRRHEARIERLERSLAAAGAGTFVAYPRTRVMHCSHSTLELLGLPSQHGAVNIDYWMSIIHPDDRDRVIACIQDAIAGGTTYSIDYRVTLGPERTFWLRTHGQPVRKSGGEPVVYGAFLDITQMKTLEVDVMARDARLRDASVAARFYMWELDLERMEYSLDRPVAGADPAGRSRNETFRYSVDTSRSMHHPADRHLFDSMLESVGSNNVPYEIEARVMHPDGTFHWMLAQGRLVTDGGPRRVRGIIQDIDQRKQAALRLQAMEARLERVIRGTNDGMWEMLCATRELWVSPRLAAMLGVAHASLLDKGEALLDRVHPENHEIVRRILLQDATGDDQFDLDVRLRNAAGEYRVMRMRGMRERDVQGMPLTVSGTVQDITERFEHEEALVKARQAADLANRAKSDFLANMSHEIRTPMNGVIGMTRILSETALDTMQREYVDIISGSADSLMRLINNVLDLSKIEADHLELEHVDFDLRDVIYQTVSPLALQANEKEIELVVTVEAGTPSHVRGDPVRLRQIITNLVVNAIKFTERGHVELRASGSSGGAGPALVRIEVIDTGIGIPPERFDRLFKAFSQIDSSTTRLYGGTGLGLSIVRRLAELMGGEVGVESVPQTGSTFWVNLRLHALTALPRPSPAIVAKRILVADDLPASRRSICYKLEFYGHEVVAVGSVDEALQVLADDDRFDVVLADESMPARGGIELLTALRTGPYRARLPFVLLSLFGTERDRSHWPHQADSIAMKPVRGVLLEAVFEQVLSGRPATTPPKTVLPGSAMQFAGCRVLLVEDNKVNQMVASRLLDRLAIDVTCAANGVEALEHLTMASFDAVLMDCQMPVMDGFTATRHIRSLERERGKPNRLPVIALTANAMSDDVERCIAAGMDAHLGKPIDPALLAECLARYLSPAEAQRAAI